jgi:hypothetical protein
VSDDSPRHTPPARIEIEGETLVLDEIFHEEVLAGANRRTGKRYESEGLPYVFIAGHKYRPLREGQRWLANRIQRRNPPPKRRAAGRRS